MTRIATLSRGTTSYADPLFFYNDNYGDTYVYYDVRAYYSVEGTLSEPSPKSVKADKNIDQIQTLPENLITEYKSSNYPNPFNPMTKIYYQLPEAGFVQLKVYDALGKEVATLVNDRHESGAYEVLFDGVDLPSGMYIYSIKVNNYYESKKMLLIK